MEISYKTSSVPSLVSGSIKSFLEQKRNGEHRTVKNGVPCKTFPISFREPSLLLPSTFYPVGAKFRVDKKLHFFGLNNGRRELRSTRNKTFLSSKETTIPGQKYSKCGFFSPFMDRRMCFGQGKESLFSDNSCFQSRSKKGSENGVSGKSNRKVGVVYSIGREGGGGEGEGGGRGGWGARGGRGEGVRVVVSEETNVFGENGSRQIGLIRENSNPKRIEDLPLARVDMELAVASAQEYVTSARQKGQKLVQEIEGKRQEFTRVVEQKLPPQAKGFIKESSGKVQNFTASVQKAVPEPLKPLFQGKVFWGVILFLFVLKIIKSWKREVARDSKGSSNFNIPEKQRTPEEQEEWESKQKEEPRAPAEIPPMGSVLELRKKESVEWLNMVLRKMVKVYRRGIERWMVGRLQPLIDDLKKPNYVQRVKVKQFYLGDEPISVRSIERVTSRRADDLQYQIGIRYTGEARMLLEIPITLGFLPLTIPVGVRDVDVDAEIWVKLKLIPCEPWVGTATWAFVTLPKIKVALAPFRLVNLMAIPFLSRFLEKLLTEDLPRLFVRPNKSVVDLLKEEKLRKRVENKEREGEGAGGGGNFGFSGELSVTIIAARRLPYTSSGTTDPYVVLELGEQVVSSKKNSETSTIGPPGAPLWNQDIQLVVVDPQKERLKVRVRDALGVTYTVGYGEIPLSILQDTVPMDIWVPLLSSWRPERGRKVPALKMRLTYKAYVDDDENFANGGRERGGREGGGRGEESSSFSELQMPSNFMEIVGAASTMLKEVERGASLLDFPKETKDMGERMVERVRESGGDLKVEMDKVTEVLAKRKEEFSGGNGVVPWAGMGGRGEAEGVGVGVGVRARVGELEGESENGGMRRLGAGGGGGGGGKGGDRRWESSGEDEENLEFEDNRGEGERGEGNPWGRRWRGLFSGLFDDGWEDLEDSSYQMEGDRERREGGGGGNGGVTTGNGREGGVGNESGSGKWFGKVKEYTESLDLKKKLDRIGSSKLREGAMEAAKKSISEGEGLEGVKETLESNKYLEKAREVVFSGDGVEVVDKGLVPVNESTREGDEEGARRVDLSTKEMKKESDLEAKVVEVVERVGPENTLLWLLLIVGVVLIVAFNLNVANPLNP